MDLEVTWIFFFFRGKGTSLILCLHSSDNTPVMFNFVFISAKFHKSDQFVTSNSTSFCVSCHDVMINEGQSPPGYAGRRWDDVSIKCSVMLHQFVSCQLTHGDLMVR